MTESLSSERRTNVVPSRRGEAAAARLNLETDKVSVKATTEEGLGFTGQKQGIAVHAVTLIR